MKWNPEIPKDMQEGAKRMIGLKKNLLAKPEQSDALSVGDVVEHPVFGQGVIQEILAEQQAIVIQFDKLNTTRTLSTRVRLKKVESKTSTPWLN